MCLVARSLRLVATFQGALKLLMNSAMDTRTVPLASPHDIAVSDGREVPAVIYFHGGGFGVGNRKSWFPTWMQKRLSSRGIVFISVDYRLIPPSTGHDVIEDIKDAFAFVATRLNDELTQAGSGLRVDAQALGVAGTSAGGLCAYLAAMHAAPRPKAVVALYAMGGDFIVSPLVSARTFLCLRLAVLLRHLTTSHRKPNPSSVAARC